MSLPLFFNQDKNFHYFVLFGLFIVVVLLRLIHLDHSPIYDEFYHILAAKGWLENGKFAIGNGEYLRGVFFTYIVAQFFNLFGEDIVTARIPALIAGSAWVVAVFYWATKHADSKSAWLTAVLMILSPWIMYSSQITRFYSLHGLVFFLMAVNTYSLVNKLYSHQTKNSVYKSIGHFVFVLALVGLSIHLQQVTFIGLVGLLMWVLLIHLMRLSNNRKRLIHLAGFVVCGVLVTLLMWSSGKLLVAWDLFRTAPHWGMGNIDNYKYYYYTFSAQYQFLILLFPVAIFFAYRKRPEVTLFCGSLFCVGIVLHSIAAAKGERYIIYILPFFFMIWAIAIAFIYEVLVRYLTPVFNHPLFERLPYRVKSVLVSSGSSLLLLVVLLMNSALTTALQSMTKHSDELWTDSIYGGEGDWRLAASTLSREIEGDVLVLTESSVKALYYLGRYDYELNAVAVDESDTRAEFGTDERLGKQAVSTVKSITKLMACHQVGLIVAEQRRWFNSPYIVPTATRLYVEKNTVKLPLPEKSHLVAFKWSNETLLSPDCKTI